MSPLATPALVVSARIREMSAFVSLEVFDRRGAGADPRGSKETFNPRTLASKGGAYHTTPIENIEFWIYITGD